MGSNSSSLSQDLLNELSELTYLHRVEILHIFKRFRRIDPLGVSTSLDYRIRGDEIMNEFHEIKCNPYADRLVDVFSSYGDGHLSFEDILDLFSALSENCPSVVKARWVFKILDFDEDSKLSEFDLSTMVERLCGERFYGGHRLSAEDSYRTLSSQEKKEIARKVIAEMDVGKMGSITANEFVHAVMKMPDFSRTFTLRP